MMTQIKNEFKYYATYFAEGKFGNTEVTSEKKLNTIAAMKEIKQRIAEIIELDSSEIVLINLLELAGD